MRARYYSTELMRFINEDIITGDISNSNSLNRYAYVEGNPATNVDPFGLEAARAARINNTVDGIYNTTKGAVLMGGGVELMKAGGIVVAAGGPAGWIIGGIMFIAGGVMFIAGSSDVYEGTQQVYYAIENVDGYAYNPVRDDLFGGDKIAYESLEFGLPSIGYGAANLGSICVSNNATTSSIAANAHYDNSNPKTIKSVPAIIPEQGSQWERTVLNSFSGGECHEVTYGEGTILYRVGGKGGNYWSLDIPPTTEYQWRVNNAIKQEFCNDASTLYKINIPENSSISGLEGTVGSQGMGLYGGANQFYIDYREVPIDWITTSPTPWYGGNK